MTPEQIAAHNACVTKINAMPEDELLTMLKSGKCPYEPEHLLGVPLGMFHCDVCGLMVVAGLPHPPIQWIGEGLDGYADFPEL